MEVRESKQGDVIVLQPVGAVDTRTAFDLEQKLDELLVAGSRSLVIDFSEVGLLASSGIRVLLMLVKRLAAVGGCLALCGLTDYVKTVLDISGLTTQFQIAATREEALASLKPLGAGAEPVAGKPTPLVGGLPPAEAAEPAGPAPQRPELSAVSAAVLELLGEAGEPPAVTGRGRDGVSRLTREIERLLLVPDHGDAEADDS